MRLQAARLLPVVANLRRPSTLALGVAGVIALAGMLSFGLLRGNGEQASLDDNGAARTAAHGGETVIEKLTPSEAEPKPAPAAKVGRRMAMLAPALPAPPASNEEPNLEGLSEIPRELIWNREPDKEDEAQPKAFAAFSKAREVLPWDAVEPVPFAPLAPAPNTAEAAGAAPNVAAVVQQPLELPDGGDVGAWLKSKVTEIKGADRARPLYHFELWLEPPPEVKRRLVGVAYDFSTPAILPQSQASSDQASGFRISAGGLACADKVTVTLRFDDGRSQKVALDGCKLFG